MEKHGSRKVTEAFQPGGAVARALPGFEVRPGQTALAEAAVRVFAEGGTLLAEAGTGVGKTLAYLLAATAAERRLLVSTATRNLQDQILGKDLPVLERILGRPVPAVALKGRNNYLCLHRFDRFALHPVFERSGDGKLWTTFLDWKDGSPRGLRGDGAWADLPETPSWWPRVDARAEACLGSRCPVYDQCHLVLHREEAKQAEVVIVNHHLLFADMALRLKRQGPDAGAVPVIRDLVLDEAHALEESAASFFGLRVSARMWDEWVADAGSALPELGPERPAVAEAVSRVHSALEEVAFAFPHVSERMELGDLLGRAHEAGEALRDLREAARAATSVLAGAGEEGGEWSALRRRLGELSAGVGGALADDEDAADVRWGRRTRAGWEVGRQPLDVAPILSDALFGEARSAVLVSATLAENGSLAYVRSRLGVPAQADELIVTSPFDYARNTVLYIPRKFPDPRDPDYGDACLDTMEDLVRLAGGGAFLLFTSHASLERARQRLAPRLGDLQVLIQGDGPRDRLAREFREDGSAVLMGAASFWQGVDMPGRALRVVAVEKIPFASPADPVVAARIRDARAHGRDPFNEFQLPAAALLLRQGLGRLLRSGSDRGILAILDPRMLTRGYGRRLLASLPPCPMATRWEEVAVRSELVKAGAP